MPRLVISTVGTSLLTNQIDDEFDSGWNEELQKYANLTRDQVNQSHPELVNKIAELKEKAEKVLSTGNTLGIREASAELNGIYGLYEEDLSQGQKDIHWLITTDTEQGRTTAEIVKSFLVDQGIVNTNIYPEPGSGLSTANTHNFSKGIAQLIPWIQQVTEGYKKQAKICFNLVGGFKAIQGYMNTIGMFYADEIIYVFEGSNKLIKIPRLPIEVNKSEVEPYKVPLAMMDFDRELLTSWEETKKVTSNWVLVVEPDMTLSTWGQLIWNQCKEYFLSQDKPLKFPKIEYTHSFLDDYKSKPSDEKVILQENLARAACLLNNHTDGISAMKQDGIFRLRRYEGKHKDIDHFDLPKARRVSCLAKDGQLYLRHYGEHDYVNNNP
ncbi:putative CRISPR-associated protein [Coleofasciculus sp. G1-WW12-02]|uniref:putative CRISPR-associated protein n=1 Tax=Coleofasciculus sp. G1-WW12-02 TaxID=3068483 RepID=UPI004062B968